MDPHPILAQLIGPGTFDCIKGLLVFFLIITPVYLVMRFLVRMTRIRYGFESEAPDDGPPLRVCDQCANTVLESDYQHCPYCGALLPALPEPREGTAERGTV